MYQTQETFPVKNTPATLFYIVKLLIVFKILSGRLGGRKYLLPENILQISTILKLSSLEWQALVRSYQLFYIKYSFNKSIVSLSSNIFFHKDLLKDKREILGSLVKLTFHFSLKENLQLERHLYMSAVLWAQPKFSVQVLVLAKLITQQEMMYLKQFLVPALMSSKFSVASSDQDTPEQESNPSKLNLGTKD